MTTTTNLGITLIDTNQSQKEVTANEALQSLEDALTEVIEIECDDATGGNVVTAAQAREAFALRLVAASPAPSTDVDVILPAVKRPIIIRNECGQSADVSVTGDLATVTVANGATALLYNDGTTVTNVAGGSSSGATVFTGLTDTPSTYSGQGLKHVRVNSGATALEFASSAAEIGISEQADNYTLVLSDAFTLIAMNKATAVTLTVPAESSVNFPTGTQIYVMQLGAGQVTLSEGATSVEVMTVSTLKTFGQYAVVRLIKLDSDLWSVDGSLEGAAGVDTFVGRPDTPANYSGAGGKLLAVNSGATAVEFKSARELPLEINAQTGTTYTLVLADAGKLVTLDNGAAITLTVPEESSVAFPVGTQILLAQIGAGQVTVAEGATGVTVITPETLLLRKEGAQAALVKIASDTWLLEGNLESA